MSFAFNANKMKYSWMDERPAWSENFVALYRYLIRYPEDLSELACLTVNGEEGRYDAKSLMF